MRGSGDTPRNSALRERSSVPPPLTGASPRQRCQLGEVARGGRGVPSDRGRTHAEPMPRHVALDVAESALDALEEQGLLPAELRSALVLALADAVQVIRNFHAALPPAKGLGSPRRYGPACASSMLEWQPLQNPLWQRSEGWCTRWESNPRTSA